MKNRHQLLNILFLLPLVFLFGPNAYPQGKDPAKDLSVSWSSRREPEPGSIFGSLTNKSVNSYPCVRIEFDLFTRFDLRKPGEQSKYLGVFTVGVKGISPRTVRNFEQPLPYPAGIGLRSVSECQPDKSVPSDMKILSFTITPATIVAGQTATLQWQTENSETVQVGMQNPEVLRDQRAERILKPRTVESSGSLQVTPSQTTTYALKATKGSLSIYPRSVTVTVTNPPPPPPPPPQGFCTIFGKVSNDLPEYVTMINIYRPGDLKRAVLTRRVRAGGEFSIPNIPVGEYDVIPRGSYPNSRMNIGPNPRARRITCQPAGSHPAYFRIQSNEG
jgi:hypothetical protein